MALLMLKSAKLLLEPEIQLRDDRVGMMIGGGVTGDCRADDCS